LVVFVVKFLSSSPAEGAKLEPMVVGVVGLGLIGGSVGLALREPGRTILGYDPDTDAQKTARDRFCVDETSSLEEVAQADVVFVAAPPAKLTGVLDDLRRAKGEHTILTDCTSVKAEAVAWALDTKEPNFVPGHPMAGHERSGAAFASAWMFRNARWILTPVKTTSKPAVKSVETLVKAMGAVPVRVDPDSHDRHVALLSHLPHALAAVLVEMGDQLDRTEVAGGSWRDLTRVGGVDPDLWTQILMGNRVELSKTLGDFEQRLADLRRLLDTEDRAAVHSFLARAQSAKAKQNAAMPEEAAKTRSVRSRR
jgi:prephenate dehydrogenase